MSQITKRTHRYLEKGDAGCFGEPCPKLDGQVRGDSKLKPRGGWPKRSSILQAGRSVEAKFEDVLKVCQARNESCASSSQDK